MNPNSPIENKSCCCCAHCGRFCQIYRLTLAGYICKLCAEQIDGELENSINLEV